MKILNWDVEYTITIPLKVMAVPRFMDRGDKYKKCKFYKVFSYYKFFFSYENEFYIIRW